MGGLEKPWQTDLERKLNRWRAVAEGQHKALCTVVDFDQKWTDRSRSETMDGPLAKICRPLLAAFDAAKKVD